LPSMKSLLVFLITCVTLLSLCHATPLFYNTSMDGSGDEAELELLFPTSFSTRAPVHISTATGAPTLTNTITNTITTTMIRLKDFVFTRVVDFLQENLLIIIVVTSLLIVMVFIICCASAMSHKSKLEAYKPPPHPNKKTVADKTGGRNNSSEIQERPYSMASPKHLRMPSKALVGERGRDVRSSPRQDVRKVREAEEVEKRREEPKHKEQPKRREEVQQSSSPSTSSAHSVCTCHLKKANH
uniref:Transmembrane protein 119 n=1 Tax=Sander lucioperca TaxID=283035 RepID=A0A8C9WSX0_SANLU